MPDELGSYGKRKEVPPSWYGKQGKELSEETGVDTAFFCHPNGFIGAAQTLEDAIRLAKLAVDYNKPITLERITETVANAHSNQPNKS